MFTLIVVKIYNNFSTLKPVYYLANFISEPLGEGFKFPGELVAIKNEINTHVLTTIIHYN